MSLLANRIVEALLNERHHVPPYQNGAWLGLTRAIEIVRKEALFADEVSLVEAGYDAKIV